MATVKTIKQGNAVMVTLPSKFGVTEGAAYYITKEADGIISLIPISADYFAYAKEYEFIDPEDDLATNFEVESQLLDE